VKEMMDMREQLQMIKDSMVGSEISTIKNKDMDNNVGNINGNKINYNKSNDKIESFKQQPVREVRRGQILWADIDGNRFSEQGGKCYPVICLSNNIGNKYSPTIIVAFITSKLDKPKLPTHTPIEGYGLPKNSVVLLEQIRTIDKRRLIGYIGSVDEVMMKRIDNAKNISMSELKPKTTFERLEKEQQQYILDKLNIIKECEVVLNFFHRLNKDANAIELAEDEKFEAENALMAFCYNNGLNCDEFYTQENGINKV
jgi:mRNA interferase MazF